MTTKEKDQEFVEYVVKSIVSKPESVEVKRSIDEMGVLLELTVDKSDMGVIIGKEGKTAKSLRTLLRVLGAKNDARINLKIVEPESKEEVAKEEDKEGASVEGEKNSKEEEKEDDEEPLADLNLDE